MLTTKISAVFLAAVLFAGAITVASPVLVDEAEAVGDKKKDKKKYKDRYDGKERYYEKYRDYDKRDRPYASDIKINNEIYLECDLASDRGTNIDGKKRVGVNNVQTTDDLIEIMVNGGNGKPGKHSSPDKEANIITNIKDMCKIIEQDGKKGKHKGQSGSAPVKGNEADQESTTQIQQVLNESTIQCSVADDGGLNIGNSQDVEGKLKEVLSADDDIDIIDLAEAVTIVVNDVDFNCSITDFNHIVR